LEKQEPACNVAFQPTELCIEGKNKPSGQTAGGRAAKKGGALPGEQTRGGPHHGWSWEYGAEAFNIGGLGSRPDDSIRVIWKLKRGGGSLSKNFEGQLGRPQKSCGREGGVGKKSGVAQKAPKKEVRSWQKPTGYQMGKGIGVH